MKNVIGIGNALTDILINLTNNDVLERFDIAPGSMNLVDSTKQKEVGEFVADMPRTLSLGGATSNTIRAMAKLGSQVGYIGKVGEDATGDFFEQAMVNLGIKPVIFRGQKHSGRCVSLVSPDGERTMCTYLGSALELNKTEVVEDIFKGYDCLYVEGYLVQDHELIEHAMRQAKAMGMKVAIDLASFNIVEENIDFLHKLVRENVDILFANEQEATAFTGNDNPREALDIISENCELSVVKIGRKGAYIKYQGKVEHVGIMEAAKRVDTTGAGDFYAAGFLFGMCKGLSLVQCGTIGAITAGKVIEVVGTTFGEEVWTEISSLVKQVEKGQYLF